MRSIPIPSRRWTAAAVVLGLLALGRAAADPIVLTGTVHGAPTRPLAGARVELVALLGNFEQSKQVLAG